MTDTNLIFFLLTAPFVLFLLWETLWRFAMTGLVLVRAEETKFSKILNEPLQSFQRLMDEPLPLGNREAA